MVDIATGIFTLAGVGFGFILNFLYSYLKEKKQLKSVKNLFQYEIKKNLELLADFIEKIKEDSEKVDDDYALEIVDLPFPRFKSLVWINQNSFLTQAFNQSEIVKIQNFYNDLDSLKSIYYHINIGIKDKNNRSMMETDSFRRILHKMYWGDFANLSKEFMNISEKLIKEGNPIQK